MRFPQFSDEWTQTTLGEIGIYIRGLTYNSDDVQESGWIVVRANNITEGKAINFDTELVRVRVTPSTQQILIVNDIAICMANGSSHLVGKASYYNGNAFGVCTVGAFCGIFRSTNSLTRWFFQTSIYNRYIYQSIQGGDGAIANLKGEDILKQIYFLPSLAEQTKIASFLSLIDERIQCLSETIKERKREKVALLNQLFSQKLRFPQFCAPWEQKTLGEVLEYEQPTNYIVRSTKYSSDVSLIPVLTANKSFILGYTHEQDAYNKGECIILDDFTLDIKFVNFPFKVKSSAIKILVAKDATNILFIYNYLLYLRFSEQEKDHKRHYISEIQPLIIGLPSLAEQKKIADFLSLVDERIEVEEEVLQQYERQKRYLLKQMFV